MVRDPLERGRARLLRINDGYDNQEIIVENRLSQKHEWIDLPNTKQLTQNSFNFSPKTRENNFEDISIKNPSIIGRIERYRPPQRLERYRDPLPRLVR